MRTKSLQEYLAQHERILLSIGPGLRNIDWQTFWISMLPLILFSAVALLIGLLPDQREFVVLHIIAWPLAILFVGREALRDSLLITNRRILKRITSIDKRDWPRGDVEEVLLPDIREVTAGRLHIRPCLYVCEHNSVVMSVTSPRSLAQIFAVIRSNANPERVFFPGKKIFTAFRLVSLSMMLGISVGFTVLGVPIFALLGQSDWIYPAILVVSLPFAVAIGAVVGSLAGLGVIRSYLSADDAIDFHRMWYGEVSERTGRYTRAEIRAVLKILSVLYGHRIALDDTSTKSGRVR